MRKLPTRFVCKCLTTAKFSIAFVGAMVIAQSAYAQGQLNVYNWGDYINQKF